VTHAILNSRATQHTIERLFDRVNAISLPGPGYTRPSYSALESRAHAVIAEHAAALGLTATRDAGLNLYIRVPGRDPAAAPLFVGSHLDTVPNGGAYDGVAGVVGAMALASDLVAAGERPAGDLVVIVTRAEESVWFPVSYIGSRSALGRLAPEDLDARRADTGRTLGEHMREEGGDPEAALSGVRGGLRYREASISGAWAHSGAAPRKARSDTVFALADLVTAMDRAWAAIEGEALDLSVTFGRVDAATPEHAFAKVPGHLDFCVDLRSDDVAVLDRADAILKSEIARIERARSLRFDLRRQSRSPPSRLSARLGGAIAEAARGLGFAPRAMLSGGGHDAAAFAQAGWEAAMIFLRNANGSHNPDEAMDVRDLAAAVQALRAALPAIQSMPPAAAP
jgi:N-carbamoyl-L-amino-acid hydrolase